MSDFINNLTSITWWIGVVIFTVVLNLAAMYLKSPVDKWLSSISTKYQSRSKTKKAEREVKIKNLVGNKHGQILHASETNFTLMFSVLLYLTGASLIILCTLITVLRSSPGPAIREWLGFKIVISILLIYGGLTVLLGNFKFAKALSDRQILMEARKRESKVANPLKNVPQM